MLTALAFIGGSTAVSASAPPFDLAAALADQVSRIPGLALHDLNRSAATLVSPGSEQSVDARRLAPCVASEPARLAACFGRAGGQGVALVVDEGRAPTAVRVLAVLPPRALLVILLGGSAARLAEVQQLGKPLLVLGGGGYTPANVARCWAYETALLCGRGDIDTTIPQNDFQRYARDVLKSFYSFFSKNVQGA